MENTFLSIVRIRKITKRGGGIVTNSERQIYWGEIALGDELPTQEFPLSVFRLVMAAGSNRDFNSIHHNTEYAQATGAPEMYANNFFLQGMWEKTVREYIGLGGVIKSLKGFRMSSFNTVGDTVRTKGKVKNKWEEGGECFVELEVWSENATAISVGPGTMIATIPNNDK